MSLTYQQANQLTAEKTLDLNENRLFVTREGDLSILGHSPHAKADLTSAATLAAQCDAHRGRFSMEAPPPPPPVPSVSPFVTDEMGFSRPNPEFERQTRALNRQNPVSQGQNQEFPDRLTDQERQNAEFDRQNPEFNSQVADFDKRNADFQRQNPGFQRPELDEFGRPNPDFNRQTGQATNLAKAELDASAKADASSKAKSEQDRPAAGRPLTETEARRDTEAKRSPR